MYYSRVYAASLGYAARIELMGEKLGYSNPSPGSYSNPSPGSYSNPSPESYSNPSPASIGISSK